MSIKIAKKYSNSKVLKNTTIFYCCDCINSFFNIFKVNNVKFYIMCSKCKKIKSLVG